MATNALHPTAPTVRDVFAVPIEDGRYAAVRVLRNCAETRTSLVACTPWLGEFPKADEPQLHNILRQHRGRLMGRLAIGWSSWPVSEEFLRIAHIPPTKDDQGFDAKGAFSGKWSPWMVKAVLLEEDSDSELNPVIGAKKRPRVST